MAALLRVNSGVGAGRVDKRKHREFEFFGQLYQTQGLAITLGFAHAEVAQTALFGVAPFLLAQHHTGRAIEPRQAANQTQIVGKVPVTMQFNKIGENQANVIQRVRALGVAGNFGDLPGA